MAGNKWECNGYAVSEPKSPKKAGWVKQFTQKKGPMWGKTVKSK